MQRRRTGLPASLDAFVSDRVDVSRSSGRAGEGAPAMQVELYRLKCAGGGLARAGSLVGGGQAVGSRAACYVCWSAGGQEAIFANFQGSQGGVEIVFCTDLEEETAS